MTEFKRFMEVKHSRHGLRYRICVDGPRGIVEFHFEVTKDRKHDFNYTFPYQFYGVEKHERVPIEEATDWSKECELLKGPCRHDGTSLFAVEVVGPAFINGGTDYVYPILEKTYRDWFEREEE